MHGSGGDGSRQADAPTDGGNCRSGSLALPAEQNQALLILFKSRVFSSEAGIDPRQLANQLAKLARHTVSEGMIRRLLVTQQAALLRDLAAARGDLRRMDQFTGLNLIDHAWFVLAPDRCTQGRTPLHKGNSAPSPDHADQKRGTTERPALAPRFDENSGSLWLGATLIKHFASPARNQRLVLKAFQEKGFPERIADPLPPGSSINRKKRLNDVVFRLNHHQLKRLLVFHAEARGMGIRWAVRAGN
jgi:hypothetical protein